MVDNNQERLNQAIRLNKSGNKQEARKILLQLIQENSKNEYAWLWLIDVCDSDRERKAVLSRGLKLNPESKLLQTAMKRFVDTGSLVLEGDSLDSLIVETKVEEIVVPPKPKSSRRDPLLSDGSDLDWIDLEEDSGTDANTLDTISEDEFTRLSQEYFTDEEDQEEESPFEDVFSSEELDEEVEDQPQSSGSGLFLLDELLAEEGQEDSNTDPSDPFIDFEDKPTKPPSQAIEDRLKGVFADGEDVDLKPQRKKISLPDFRTISRHALIMIVSAFWLIVIVLLGLFAIQYLGLEDALSLDRSELQPTPTEMIPDGPQVTGIPEEDAEALLPTTTPTPVPVQANVGTISRENLVDILPLETFTQPFPLLFNRQGEFTAILDLRTIRLMDVSGLEVWQADIPSARAIGGGFSQDDTLLGIFSDDMRLRVWDVNKGYFVNEFDLSEDLQLIYSQIPYLPQDAHASVHFSSGNDYVAASFWGGITIWELDSGKVVHEYSLPQSILVNSFDAGLDLNFVMAFNPKTPQIVYGTRENIYLIDVETGTIQQNWKTQYVGSLEWVGDDEILEAGYPLNNLMSYVSLWQTNNLYPILKENVLPASRGMHLPRYGYFERTALLALEIEGVDANKIAIKVISLLDGVELSRIPLETFQPLLGIVDVANETIFAVWAQIPKEGFGVADSVQFFDVDTSELISTCNECAFLSGILADQYELYINEAGTLITQYAEGIGSQQLAIPAE